MKTEEIFKLSRRPDSRLFFKSHDPNDPRLGGVVFSEEKDYPSSHFVILGCPEDEGVKRNRGRPGARKSPSEIRRFFYRLTYNPTLRQLKIFDLGDIRVGKTLEETHEKLRQVVRKILEDGKIAIVLGGGNDISYPDCAALAEVKKNILVFNIDKHFDVRALSPRNSGTAYRQLLESSLIDPHKFYEMGSESFSNSPVYRDYLEKKGARIYELDQMREKGIESLFRKIISEDEFEAVFWGFDLDAVRESDAPGVSASCPTGLTAKEAIDICRTAGEVTEAGVLEFTEVNPELDIDGRTSKLTAILIHTFLAAQGESGRFKD